MSGARGRGDLPSQERGAASQDRGAEVPPHTPQGKYSYIYYNIFITPTWQQK